MVKIKNSTETESLYKIKNNPLINNIEDNKIKHNNKKNNIKDKLEFIKMIIAGYDTV